MKFDFAVSSNFIPSPSVLEALVKYASSCVLPKQPLNKNTWRTCQHIDGRAPSRDADSVGLGRGWVIEYLTSHPSGSDGSGQRGPHFENHIAKWMVCSKHYRNLNSSSVQQKYANYNCNFKYSASHILFFILTDWKYIMYTYVNHCINLRCTAYRFDTFLCCNI